MEPNTGIRTWQWVVTVIVIIVLIIIGILVFGKGSSPAVTDNTQSTTTDQTEQVTGNRLTMTDQYPGNVVYVSAVQMEKDGWVAIHKDVNGQPGEIIGYAPVKAGINPVKITLTKPLVDGQSYIAMLHGDDGDGKFDEAKDAALKDASGAVILKVFKASASVGAGFKG
jgi:hypothetical protein